MGLGLGLGLATEKILGRLGHYANSSALPLPVKFVCSQSNIYSSMVAGAASPVATAFLAAVSAALRISAGTEVYFQSKYGCIDNNNNNNNDNSNNMVMMMIITTMTHHYSHITNPFLIQTVYLLKDHELYT